MFVLTKQKLYRQCEQLAKAYVNDIMHIDDTVMDISLELTGNIWDRLFKIEERLDRLSESIDKLSKKIDELNEK